MCLGFLVAGLLKSGTEVDQSLALIDFGRTYERLGEPANAQGVRVVLKDLFNAGRLSWELVRALDGPYYTTDWMRTHGNLYHAIQLSRNLVLILLVLRQSLFVILTAVRITNRLCLNTSSISTRFLESCIAWYRLPWVRIQSVV